MSAPPDPLHGFEPWERTSPFGNAAGPLMVRREAHGLTFAVRIEERHTNARGTAHGGVLSTIADMTVGYAVAMSTDPPTSLRTASMTIDFIATVRVGDIVLSTPRVLHVGSRLAHAEVVLLVDDRPIARASSTLAVAN